jgi:hypothetical protein
MAGSGNSKNSRLSKGRVARGGGAQAGAAIEVALCFLACAAVMAAAVWWFYRTGATLYWGDAQAHLDIARRVVDSRTPGWGQIGTTWLPLPHVLMLPLVKNDFLWRTGLAGGIASGFCMAVGGTFLFAAMRRVFGGWAPGAAAVAVFLLNPNTLYLGAIPMTEAVFFCSLFGLLFFTVRFAETHGWGALAGASVAALAGTLTRYEAWFLLPFVAGYVVLTGASRRWKAGAVFCAVAGLGPALWLVHNFWYFGDPLYFYRGPWSALAIQGKLPYPGKGDWRVATRYFLEAGEYIAGLAGLAAGAVGVAVALGRKAFWPVVLLILSPIFYVWGIHSSGNPIFVPDLTPYGWYNTRYAMALLPMVALGAAAVARFGKAAAAGFVAVALLPFLLHPDEHSITWQEAEMNSRAQRKVTAQAVAFLNTAGGSHETYFTSYGMTSIYRGLGVPIRNTLSGDNGPQFFMASANPRMFLWEDWAVTTGGDAVQSVIDNARLHGPRYELSERIFVPGQPVVEIYHRTYENPVR